MAQTTQTDVMQSFSYLLGESSVPTSNITDRQHFIQKSLERIYRIYDFDLSMANATVALVGGVASLPSVVRQDPELDIRIVNADAGDDKLFTRIDSDEKDNFAQGSYKYWLEGYEGAYTVNTKEADATLSLRFTQAAPTINASIATPFPSSMAVARGALVYYRQAEDPEADISQEEQLFQMELQEVIAAQNRSRAPRRAKSIAEKAGTYTGQLKA